jgi:hypothetical protein
MVVQPRHAKPPHYRQHHSDHAKASSIGWLDGFMCYAMPQTAGNRGCRVMNCLCKMNDPEAEIWCLLFVERM